MRLRVGVLGVLAVLVGMTWSALASAAPGPKPGLYNFDSTTTSDTYVNGECTGDSGQTKLTGPIRMRLGKAKIVKSKFTLPLEFAGMTLNGFYDPEGVNAEVTLKESAKLKSVGLVEGTKAGRPFPAKVSVNVHGSISTPFFGEMNFKGLSMEATVAKWPPIGVVFKQTNDAVIIDNSEGEPTLCLKNVQTTIDNVSES